jgi:hemerythrin-like domain-containing protein
MLRAIPLLLDEHRRRGTLPDFGALRAMLFYIDEFPEKLHHPKESALLFPHVRGHNDAMDAVLDKLELDHAQGERVIRELQHDLTAFEALGDSSPGLARRERFESSLREHVGFYLAHMQTEELEVLPLAKLMLSGGEWSALDDAFAANRDPLTGFAPPLGYEQLFTRIASSLRLTGGVGSALEALAAAGRPWRPDSRT